MSKKQTNAVDLGILQNNLAIATNHLKLAQRAKLRADAAYEDALKLHEQTRVTFNAGVAALKTAAVVPNLYAE